ncbi:MAG: purine-nucleoside phosphorylase [Clostridia bacterium]|nr:purine-nucleoside phosphorylase [Clostridia bacterium]
MSNHTPHINAQIGDFAPTVLMPGDPLRSKFIAENYIEGARLVNNVRGVQGYTGTYKGVPVSVMASGMGIPSIGIYSYELYKFFGVENIIRVGSAGGMQPDVRLRDVIIGMGACTTSRFGEQYGLEGSFAPICSYPLLRQAVDIAEEMGVSYKVGNLLSSDIFYNANPDASARWTEMGVLGVEMEAAGLYMNAAHLGKRALAICTVSDHLLTGESLSAELRQTSFTEMMEIALNIAVRMAKNAT